MPKILYACQICGKVYRTEAEAVVCETRLKDEPLAKVGDIVIAGGGRFGWFDGDKRWTRRGKGGIRNDISLLYVVTHMDGDSREPHRLRYHLFTKAMKPDSGYHHGHTYNNGHYTPHKIQKPSPFLVRDSRDLIGLKTDVII